MHLHILFLASSVNVDVDAFMSDTSQILPTTTASGVWINLMRAQQRLLAAMERDLKAAGLPPLGWYDVLWELDKAADGRLRPYEIEERTLLAQYNLSRLIDRLEKAGFVQRETYDNDGRGRWVVITEEGRATRTRMWETYRQSIDKHIGTKFDEKDGFILAELLARLR